MPVQDITCPGGGENRSATVHEHALAGSGDQAPVAFEQDDAAEPVHSPSSRLEPVRVHPRRLLVDQPPELAGMRREDTWRGPVTRLELPERVAVDDGGELRVGQQPAYARFRALASAEPGPDGE